MRVVSGKYKGKRFDPPRNFPSRPTTDFAKEALFNILENEFEFENLSVLDLCAGTGSISLEFLSRGVKHVDSVDESAISCKFLQKMKTELGEKNWNILKKDAFQYLEQTSAQYDIIFADAPFAMKGQDKLSEIIFKRKLLTEKGLFVQEHGRENDFQNITHFRELRNYGGVCFSFFED